MSCFFHSFRKYRQLRKKEHEKGLVRRKREDINALVLLLLL